MAKILIGDDSWLTRQMLSKFLKRGGYEVVTAENGTQVLELYMAEQPDCLILDLLMPDMDGLELIRRLKKMGINKPIMVLTADIQSTTQQQCRDEGAFDFLMKPPNEENILYKVKVALENSSGR